MQQTVTIGIIGDHNPDLPYHTATQEALIHAAATLPMMLRFEWIPSRTLTRETAGQRLAPYQALWSAPGDVTHMAGVLEGIRVAREQGRPFMGTCGGFQHAVIEFARHVAGIHDAQHEETSPDASALVVSKLGCSLKGKEQEIHICSGTRAFRAYGRSTVSEQFVCNYGLNPQYRKQIEIHPLRVSGVDRQGDVRIVELDDHPFFMTTLFQPQIASQPGRPHPLVVAYLKAVAK